MPESVDLARLGAALHSLREDAGVGLREHARGMEIAHTRVLRIEGQAADLRIGTIAGYVAALGGELAVTVTMPDGRVVDLLELAAGEE